MNYQLIRNIVSERKIKFKQMADAIGMSDTGLSRCITNETMSVQTLEKVAEYLGVNATIFFEKDVQLTTENIALKRKCARCLILEERNANLVEVLNEYKLLITLKKQKK